MEDIELFDNDLCHPCWDASLLHRQHDEWGEIMVIDQGNLRILSFEGVFEQSRQDRDKPDMLTHDYTRAMLLVLAFIEPENITILGLGGGCLVRTLHLLCEETTLEVVELRQAVVDVTKEYFGLPKTSLINMHVNDAKNYLEIQPNETTNIIFADMYHAYEMDSLQNQERFLVDCHRALTAEGWLVINYHKIPDLDSAFFERIDKLFDTVLICPVPFGNHILFAGKTVLTTSLESHISRMEPFQSRMPIRFDLFFNRLIEPQKLLQLSM